MAMQPRMICKFFLQGHCAHDESCWYSHDQEPLSNRFLGPATDPSGSHTGDLDMESIPRMNAERFSHPMTVLNGGAGIFVPCKYFQNGNCIRGATCKYAHVVQGASRSSATLSIDRSDLMGGSVPENDGLKFNTMAPEPMSEIETRLMGGSISVTFGPGLGISAVSNFNSASSPIITIRNLTPSTNTKDLMSLLSSFKEDIDFNAIRIVRVADPETVYATVNIGNSTTAATVVKALDGSDYEENTLSVKLLQTKGLVTSASQDATRISCSWFTPVTTAYAHFGNYDDARAAAEGGKKTIRGRLVECKFRHPGVGRTSFAVWLGGLDPETTTEEIKQVLRCKRVKIRKLSYSISDEEAAVRVRSLFDQKKKIEEFEIVSKPNSRKMKAIIRFETAEDARTSFNELNGARQRFLGDSPLDLSLIFSAKFGVLADIYRAVASELDQISQEGSKEGFVKVKIFGGDGCSLVIIRAHGPERSSVASTKAAIQKVVRGEIGCDDKGGVLWDPSLSTTEGMTLAKDTILSTGAYIYCDPRKRQVSLYGSPTARAEARAKLITGIERINSQTQKILLGALSIGKAMRGGLKAKMRQLGNHRFSVDRREKSITFRGTFEEVAIVKQCLSEILEKCRRGEVPKNDGEGCLICLGDLEDSRTAPCGHQYCRACLERFLKSSIDIETQRFPLKCVGKQDAPACTTEFSIPFIEKVGLSKIDMDKLFAAAFDDYIRLHIKDYQYCPTPSCCGVYSTTATGEMITCSECFVGICTTCNVEAHDGQTCAENKRSDPGEGEKLFKEWKKKEDVRACPHCGVDIEKAGGCNHITCGSCKSHICWFCMEVVGDGVYGHMMEEHGGIGDLYEVEDDW